MISNTIRPPRKSTAPLSHSWVSVNTDCSIRAEDAFVVTGGFLHDHNGRWIIGFNRYLGSCNVLDSELWGILDSLKLALDRGFDSLISDG